MLSLLFRFGNDSTVADAAAAAAIELDGSFADVIAMLVERGLLISVIAGPIKPPLLEVARRRIDEVVDPGSFQQTTGRPITTGFATIDARTIAIASWEPGVDHGIEEVLALQEAVLAKPCPVVYILDRFALGYRASDFHGPRSIGRIYANQAHLSGRVPQIAIVCGALQRPAALLPVGCDLVVFLETHGFVHIGDRDIVKQMTGEDASPDQLGGARMHFEVSGLCHLVAQSSSEAATLVRRYLGFMPATEHDPPVE